MRYPISETAVQGESRALATLALGVTAWLSACAATPVPVQPPVAAEASQAFAAALHLWREGDARELDAALAAARDANRLAPDWVAPLRFVDDRLRDELLGPNALERHRDVLADDPGDAVHLYLAGRLEGVRGVPRLRRAAMQSPGLAWAQHGLGWMAFQEGRVGDAIQLGEGALARSRDSFERANFSTMLARYLRASNEHHAAAAVLERCLADPDLSERSRAWVAVDLTSTELAADEPQLRRRGVRRALDLIAHGPVTRGELDQLTGSLRFPSRPLAVRPSDVDLALATRASERAGAYLPTGLPDSVLALELLRRDVEGEEDDVLGARHLRLARMRHGDPRRAVEGWRQRLPAQVLDGAGLPRDERLRRVVLAARALGDTAIERATPEVAREFGDALIDAGWFGEALAIAKRVPAEDLDYAQDLHTRAEAGCGTMEAIADLLRNLQIKRPRFPAWIDEVPVSGPSEEAKPPKIRNLEHLLDALTGIFQRAHGFLGGEQDREVLRQQLAASPRVDYGWVGGVLHPGARFSKQDERLGRGKAGELVSGIAHEFNRLGRFAVIGDMAGAHAPDGTVLELVLLEERSGEHLGIPWSGTVAWCESGDFMGGASRAGVAIGGAALHEGYFVDLDVVRQEFERWQALAQHFRAPDGAERVSRALAIRGLPVARGESWTSRDLLLGEADRMRLAVMADRADDGEILGSVPFEEFVEMTAVHEEGHLCDRTRLYPVSEHVFGVLGLLFSVGFMPAGAERLLEYRAELVALCEIDDPRLAWAEILQAAESGDGLTPHTAAYTRLLRDLLEEAQRAWQRDPLAWRELDPDRMLVHQLHHLGIEKLRSLALAVARRKGYRTVDQP